MSSFSTRIAWLLAMLKSLTKKLAVLPTAVIIMLLRIVENLFFDVLLTTDLSNFFNNLRFNYFSLTHTLSLKLDVTLAAILRLTAASKMVICTVGKWRTLIQRQILTLSFKIAPFMLLLDVILELLSTILYVIITFLFINIKSISKLLTVIYW